MINDNARRAFETVLFVRQRLYTGDRFRRFASSVVDFAREINRTKYLTHETVRISARDERRSFFVFVRFDKFLFVELEFVSRSE